MDNQLNSPERPLPVPRPMPKPFLESCKALASLKSLKQERSIQKMKTSKAKELVHMNSVARELNQLQGDLLEDTEEGVDVNPLPRMRSLKKNLTHTRKTPTTETRVESDFKREPISLSPNIKKIRMQRLKRTLNNDCNQ